MTVSDGHRLVPVESQESRRISIALAERAGRGEDAAQIADAIVSACQEIIGVLHPIIGHSGVGMLYKRSLHLIGPAHPCLTGMSEGEQTAIDLGTLRSVLLAQTSANGAAAGGALLQTFYDLLASLIGPSLTERLLRPIWAKFPSGPPAQDTSP